MSYIFKNNSAWPLLELVYQPFIFESVDLLENIEILGIIKKKQKTFNISCEKM